MKIAYISRSFMPSHEASSIHVVNMCEALSDMGHEVRLFCPDMHKTSEAIFSFYGVSSKFDIRFLPYPDFKGKALFYAYHVGRELRSFKPDLVISRFSYGGFLATTMNLPTVYDLHGTEWERGRLMKLLFHRLVKQKSLRKITFNSKGLKAKFERATLPLRSGLKLEVLPNGSKTFPLDETVYLPGENALKAGYFGNLYRGRGIELLIDIASTTPTVDFIVVGGSEKEIKQWKAESLPKNVYFLGFVAPGDVCRYRNSVQVLLAPYADEVSMAGNSGNSASYMNPIKIIEYMSSRKVILASDMPAIREILNPQNAILLNNRDAMAWSHTLSQLAQNFSRYQGLADQAYTEFRNNYTWKMRAEKMIKDLHA